jgi:hypothetical protein
MKISDLIRFDNRMDVATEEKSLATVSPVVFRQGDVSAPVDYVNPTPTHTDYLWYDTSARTNEISNLIDADSELLGAISKNKVLATSGPVSIELDPTPRFPYGIIPYDLQTKTRLLLAIWFRIPETPPLFAASGFVHGIWKVEHTGALDLNFSFIYDKGVRGFQNLSLMDESGRESIFRLFQTVLQGHFMHEAEADVFISDLEGDFLEPKAEPHRRNRKGQGILCEERVKTLPSWNGR